MRQALLAGDSDSLAPQLYGIFAEKHIPVFKAAYQVFGWDWRRNCRAGLIALYQALNNSGRHDLAAVRAGQMVGHPRTNEVKVAIRNSGSFMDACSRKDWWIGR